MFSRHLFSHIWPTGLLLLHITAATSANADRKVPGIAFSLTPDYGTAAITFPNGSSVSVARIEGSPTYKSFMRNLDGNHHHQDEPESPYGGGGHGMWCPSIIQPLLDSLHLINLLPFGPHSNRTSDFSATQSLLRGLQSSVASYLGTSFCFADVVVPDTTQFKSQAAVITKALESIGLRQTDQRSASTGISDGPHLALSEAISYLYCPKHSGLISSNNHDDDESSPPQTGEDEHRTTRTVLTIDYSASGLSAVLFSEDMGIIDVQRRLYDQELGAAAPNIDHDCWKKVEEALTNLVTPSPQQSGGEQGSSSIQQVVLYGDAILASPVFLDLLRRILGSVGSEPDLVDGALSCIAEANSDPAFLPAVGMARASYGRMDTIDFDRSNKAAFGCRFWSGLYRGSHEDL